MKIPEISLIYTTRFYGRKNLEGLDEKLKDFCEQVTFMAFGINVVIWVIFHQKEFILGPQNYFKSERVVVNDFQAVGLYKVEAIFH